MNIVLAIISALLTLFAFAQGFIEVTTLGVIVTGMAVGFEIRKQKNKGGLN